MLNKVILMGRLVKEPEVRYSQGAEPIAVARYTLAVNRRFKRQGEPENGRLILSMLFAGGSRRNL